ncbi:hypothetical protein IV203_024283 [Nitzschia inconspicua]|uniref:Uncharacterized protein n=1 Tax=Nitzschia inconspicua TaxID=303405 RepID=A0A9K3KCL7_9STRA|nr:hypothetical protein IV203_024283 [Nitzschia inconspicua]
MAMMTIPEDYPVVQVAPEKVNTTDRSKTSSVKWVSMSTGIALILFLVVVIGTDFIAPSSHRHLFSVVSHATETTDVVAVGDQHLVRRRLQIATPSPAPTLAPALPSVQTDINFTVCGTCGIPVLGPFVTTLTSSFSSEGWDATVSILGRSDCSQCGSTQENEAASSTGRFLQDRATQETFSFEIIQVPNENATTSALNTTESVAQNSTDRIEIQAFLNNTMLVNEMLVQVANATSLATGITVNPFFFQSFSAESILIPVPDEEINPDIPTAPPSTAANQVGNRFLMGRRYLDDIGHNLPSLGEAEDLPLFETSPMFLEELIPNEESDEEGSFQCKCLSCRDDLHCGGLWYGSVVNIPEPINRTKIHIIISHCKSDLSWLEDFSAGHIVDSVTVISKCGAEVTGGPDGMDILILPNVGRCDHTYAYYMAYMMEEKVPSYDRENAVVFFLKDDISAENLHQDGSWNSFSDMLQIASSERGFACGIQPSFIDAGPSRYFVSAYHEYETLKEFSMHSYSRNIKGYSSDTVSFHSGFSNIDEWSRSLPGNPEPQEIVPVCYGGVFAASVSNILSQDPSLWQSLTQSLSRGNNIQEGHFAERSWARLLSSSLNHAQIQALSDTADGVYLNEAAMHGPLTRTPKIYIHAGAPAAGVAAVEKSLTRHSDMLKTDGYRIAVHGHPELGVDIDRLAACMWNGFETTTFTQNQMSSTFCPPQFIRDFERFMTDSMNNRQDVILSNPWLARDSSADAIGHFLDSKWEVHPVVFYRRYYDWIAEVFKAWRSDSHFVPTAIPMSTIRQIDFIREYCKRLFYGSMIPDDAPYREFTSDKLPKNRMHHDRLVSTFHPHLLIEEMTDLKEYTYFVAKQYEEVPRFLDKVHIVNYHSDDAMSSLYCSVLSRARNSCKNIQERNWKSSEQSNSTEKPIIGNLIDEEYGYVELALGAYMRGKFQLPSTADSGGFHSQVIHWAKVIRSNLDQSNHTFSDLPVECLEDFEMQRLLQVSLAYERSLLPEFFASPKGELDLRGDFATRTFCSLDVAETLRDRKWGFLFEYDETRNLLEAYIHIGGPSTNSWDVQQAMIKDHFLFEQDNYFMAIHGATRSAPKDDVVTENMLFDSDLIGPCLWDQEERNRVATMNAVASVCKPGLLPRFRRFLDGAAVGRKNLVVSNEGLSRMSSERGLDKLFDADVWNVNIVLYYRRYFKWLESIYNKWRGSINTETIDSLSGKVQFVDFCRLVNRRLFNAGPIGFHDERQARTDALVDLVDIQEYTYPLWRQFSSMNRFQTSIHVVDHNEKGIQSLYCDIFRNAENACNSAKQGTLGFDATAHRRSMESRELFAIENLVIGSFYRRMNLPGCESNGVDEELPILDDVALKYWVGIVQSNMLENSVSLLDLPRDCLDESEMDLLQDVSLAFEKFLLPDKYHDGGARELVKEFSVFRIENRFCSVDIDAVTSDDKLVETLFSTDGHAAPPRPPNRHHRGDPLSESRENTAQNDDMVDIQLFF